MSVRVWSYWEGPRPPWIRLCLRTMRRNIPGIEILGPPCWAQLYDGIDVPPEILNAQRPNVKSDFIRAYLLHSIGGIWIDADAIVFRDVRPIFELLQDREFVTYKRARGMYCAALIASQPSSRVAARYYATMVKRLNESEGTQLPRMALGPQLLGQACRSLKIRPAFMPPRLVHQVHGRGWGRAPRLWQPAGTWEPDADAYCCMLTHQALGPARRWRIPRLLRGDTVVSACYRRALGVSA